VTVDASDWDERYAGADLVWSAGPNVWVREVCTPLTPGRALDVAAGEGRNAIWLVEQGWTVTASDFSPVAVSRIRDLATERLDGVELRRLEAVVADATQPAPGTAYDLVLFSYLHLVREEWDRAVAAGVEAAAVGGRVLVVGHARRNLAEGVGGPQDATILLDPEDVLASVAGLPVAVELAQLRARDVEGEPRPALDTVVLLRRTVDAPAR
jgi:SAM-dependent methyltransferase